MIKSFFREHNFIIYLWKKQNKIQMILFTNIFFTLKQILIH